MIKETYSKEFDKKNGMICISFEGNEDDIRELRDYVRIINSVCREAEENYYRGFKNKEKEDDNVGNFLEKAYDDLKNSNANMEYPFDHVNEMQEAYADMWLNHYETDKDADCDGRDYENELCDIVSGIMEEEDFINHPSHYTNSGMECIDEMILLYGEEEVMSFCKLNAHKYRKRALDKGGKQDMEKSDWYLAKYKELKESIAKHDATQYELFLSGMARLLNNGACLDIDNENFIRLYEDFLVYR